MSGSVDRPRRLWTTARTAGMILGLLSLAPAVFAGQQEATSIVGVVADESGAVLPGVTVTASSPSLQVGVGDDGHRRSAASTG